MLEITAQMISTKLGNNIQYPYFGQLYNCVYMSNYLPTEIIYIKRAL